MKNTFSIQQIITDQLRKEEKERKHDATSFYASSLGSCKRKQIYKRKNTPETNPADDRGLKVFSVGNSFHSWLTDIIERSGATLKTEVEVISEEFNLKGRVDAIIEKDGKTLIYEIKSINSMGFSYLKKPKEEHIMQLISYLWLTENYEGRIIYLSKDDARVLEFPVYLTDELLDKVKDELKILNHFYKNNALPSRLPLDSKNKKNWQCNYCSYRDICQKGRNKIIK